MSRHQTSDDHDHSYIKPKERRCCNIEKYKCPTCGNNDSRYIGYRAGHPYCRRCVVFPGVEVRGDLSYPKEAYYKLDYDLTEDQKRISQLLIDNYRKGKNTLVHAVCGSGKTEIVLSVIRYAIECGERVGFAIPRRDVVIEIYHRMHEIFKRNKVVYVCGGHTEETEGALVILTTHQLYRYKKYFDLLIVDEIDAFPFNGNKTLEAFFKNAVKRNYIMMSATPTDNALKMLEEKNGETVELFSRYHMHPLPVPKVIKRKWLLLHVELVSILRKMLKETKQVFIFTPTIDECELLFMFLKLFVKEGTCLHSKKDNRQEIIADFRDKKYKYIVTTAILERGVTFPNLQVIVFKADHSIYDSHALIQIAGRVGRKRDYPEGEVIFLVHDINEEINKSIAEIERANKSLQNLSKNV